MNFFKKHWVAILIILFFSIVFIIGFFEGINETKQEQKSLSNYHKDFEDDKELKQPSRTKRENIETPKIKKTITKDDFEKIKNYVFSEIDDITLLPNNINEEEKTEINKIKQKLINDITHSKDYFNRKIKKIQQECDNYNKQINELNQHKNKNEFEVLNEIEGLNEILQRAENHKKDLEKDLNQRLEQHKQSALSSSFTSSLNSLYER
ncbi:MAG: hypothetical protein AB3N34_02750 [Lettuce witches'-broom phytoplasma]